MAKMDPVIICRIILYSMHSYAAVLNEIYILLYSMYNKCVLYEYIAMVLY